MGKLVWKSGTMLYPVPAVLVSCGTVDEPNAITIAWTGILNTEPAMTYISVRKERYSYDIIKKSKEFVINLVSEDLVYSLDYCGVRSGKNEDKFLKLGMHAEEAANVSAPTIKEAPISIECRVKQVIELGTHDMFMAEIVSVDVDEKYLDADGKFDMEKCKLVAYSHGKYYALGKVLGKFGYSVAKNVKPEAAKKAEKEEQPTTKRKSRKGMPKFKKRTI